MKIRADLAEKVYEMVLPGLTTDGSLSQAMQRRLLEFVLRTQGIKEPASPERIFDFSSVRRVRADLEAKRWKPEP
jgi:hypothetical protein